MKHVFLCCLFLFVTFGSFSQNSGYQYEPSGHATSYQEGCYYTHSGEKISGLIKWECSEYSADLGANFILFKSTAGEKKEKLTTKDVKAFVIEKDSFAIIKSFSRSDLIHYSRDFARVVQVGNLILYSHCQEVKAGNAPIKPGSMTTPTGKTGNGTIKPGISMTTSTGIECFYYLKKDNALYRLKRGDFKGRANYLFGDNTALMNKISKKELDFNDLEQIVAEYNAWYENKNSEIKSAE